jgi:hypothetical protein
MSRWKEKRKERKGRKVRKREETKRLLLEPQIQVEKVKSEKTPDLNP